MTNAQVLYERLDAHLEALSAKMERIEETQTPIPSDEFKRDMAIGIELLQQYVDLLDEVKEKLEDNSSGGEGYFSEFCKKFDRWFSGLTPEQQEQYTRKGEAQ
jgi:hypothetical protein